MRFLFVAALLALGAAQQNNFKSSFVDDIRKNYGAGERCRNPKGMQKEKDSCTPQNGIEYCRFKCKDQQISKDTYTLICGVDGEAFPEVCDICSNSGMYYLHKNVGDLKRNVGKCRGADYCKKICENNKCNISIWDCAMLQHEADIIECIKCKKICYKICKPGQFASSVG